MKYESEIIKEIVDARGHEYPSLHYESECIETWIAEEKGAYPKLTDYQAEWLNYIAENPNGKFPYVTISDVTEATIDNVVPYAYKSAILSGSTKYRDVDTGEFLETFEEGRNLELVSVKMPVLTTSNGYLWDKKTDVEGKGVDEKTGELIEMTNSVVTDFIKLPDNKTIYKNVRRPIQPQINSYDKDKNFIEATWDWWTGTNQKKVFDSNVEYIRIRYTPDQVNDFSISIIEDNVFPQPTFKSNILTVNEDVTLRSNGNICDELNLLTGQLTQRIDEDGEVLSQEVVKTVDLTITNQDGEPCVLRPIEGKMYLSTSSNGLKPTFSGEVPVEAITQNLASFIEE